MSELDKTLLSVHTTDSAPAAAQCPLCSSVLEAEPEKTGVLRCPRCGFTKKERFSVETGSILKNRYKILNHFSSGGCGDLYLCCPLEDFSVRYILKTLQNTSREGRLRFYREAEILAGIQDEERVARVIDYGEIEENGFIIMEYIQGKNLHELMDLYEFDEESVLQIAREVVLALQHIYEQYSVIHRDIKPDNIMLDEEGHLKVLDFGLSKQLDSSMHTDITMTDAGLGTPGYMSPEQFRDSRNVDFRADIFSLGATLYFLMTREKPFSGSTTAEIYAATLENSPPPSRKLASFCSRKCIELIRHMMEKDVEKRPASYDELLREIQAALEP